MAQHEKRRNRFGVLLAALSLSGCAEQAPTEPPPPEVEITVAKPQSAPNVIEVPGRVQAVRTAEVRARVDGIVQERLYEEGSDVREGQKLFLIDPSEYQAAVNAAKAALVRAQATAANAEQDVQRYKGLVQDGAISQQEYDSAVAALRTARADVAQARAQLQSAQLNLSHTIVTAPIAGRAGRAQVTEGALVSAAAATLLTTIEQLDPVYVNFSQSSAELLQVRREVAQGQLKVPELRRVEVHLILEDGSQYTDKGHIDFLDLAINQETGTVALRAEFPNPKWLLLPGQFVRARIEAGTRPNAILIPQRAVQLSQQGASVMLVGDNNIVAARPVQLGEQQQGAWVIREGLEAGDRVIVSGLQKVRPGQPVRIAESGSRPAAASSTNQAPGD